jgi:hypothetical protein
MNLPHEKTWKKLISVGEGHAARFPILSKNFVTYTNFVHALVTKKAQYIYQTSKLLASVVCFAELV